MTRSADSSFRDRRLFTRSLSSVFANKRARVFALSVAFGLAAISGGSKALSATYGSLYAGRAPSPSATSATAKSQYYANPRAAQQAQYQQSLAAQQAQYQQSLAMRQQAQYEQSLAMRQQAQYEQSLAAQQAQYQQNLAAQQASIFQGQPVASSAQRQKESKPKILSGLFNSKPTANQQQTPIVQKSQPIFEPRQELPSEPPRNNFLGMQPLIPRSSQQRASKGSQPKPQQQPEIAPQFAHAEGPSYLPSTQPNYAAQQSRQSAIPSAEALAQASTDRNEARDLLARVPWDALSPNAQEKIRQLTSSATIYRRLPMAGGRCNPELFDFFLTHPNAIVELWRSMGYEEVSMVDEGAGIYALAERSGSTGKLQIIYQDAELTLAYCSGSYRGAAIGRPMSGEMFLALQTRYTEDANRTPFVVCRMDAFVDLKNPGVDLLARTFSSAIGKIGDSNFEQTLAFIDSVSQAIEANPEDFAMVAMGLQGLSPDARRLLAAKAERVGAQAEARRMGQLVESQLLPKRNSPVPTYARILSRGSGQLGEHAAVATSQPLPAPRPSYESPESYATSGLPSRNSSLGRTIAYDREPEPSEFDFSLSDEEDFESTIDWDDDEPVMTKIYNSKGEPNNLGTSVAKVGAKPSTRANAMSILDEQESRVAPSYSQAYSSNISSDDDDLFSLTDLDEDEELDEEDVVLDSDEFALNDNDQEEAEEEEVEVVNKATRSLVALPFANGKPNAMRNKLPSTVVAATPLASTDESTDEELDEEPIMLVFPDEIDSEEISDDSQATDVDEAPLAISADEDASESDDVALDVDFETPEDASADESVALEAADESDEVAQKTVKAASKQKSSGDSIEKRNENFGWTPAESNYREPAPKKVDRVAMRIDPGVTTRGKTNASSAWNRANDEQAQPSVPSKFVTRHYARAEVSGAVQGKAKTLATFSSNWQDPEEVKQINPVDAPTFKRPE